jgi:hypothetical protein
MFIVLLFGVGNVFVSISDMNKILFKNYLFLFYIFFVVNNSALADASKINGAVLFVADSGISFQQKFSCPINESCIVELDEVSVFLEFGQVLRVSVYGQECCMFGANQKHKDYEIAQKRIFLRVYKNAPAGLALFKTKLKGELYINVD